VSARVRRSYGTAIRDGFVHLLEHHPEVFVIGQGLWSPWYVGNTMTELEVLFGKDRIIDTPVSELACTGAALGAAVAGRRPIVVHPRMDFMLLAVDQIVTQAAKWSTMFGGRVRAPMLIRGIVNRGGEQGAQHSQSLHSWFAHIPGLRVVMPASPADARDMLVSGTLVDDPVLYIDDRWLYEEEEEMSAEPNPDAIHEDARVVRAGDTITLVAAGYSVKLATDAAVELAAAGIDAEVIDLRMINPLPVERVVESVRATGRLLAVDGGWSTCGLAGEIIATVVERLDPSALKARPRRITIQDAPTPTSRPLEAAYYPTAAQVAEAAAEIVGPRRARALPLTERG
jgi:pyruvate/2-oxoglutarate/acetoin dehydrogenase E1 component